MSTVALWRFDEINDVIRPVDSAGNVNDLAGDTGLAMPTVVTSTFGRGRSFGANIGLKASELVADSTRLTRDVTIRAFLTYAIAAAANGDKGTVVVRGKSGSAAERILFGVEIERVDATTATLRARWQDAAGTEATVAGATFIVPEGGIHIAVVRRWISTTEVEVDYMVNETLIGSETVVLGDIGNGSGGTLVVGAAGSYQRFLPTGSVIDMLSIEDDAMSIEELRADYRRAVVHQPDGYRVLRAYLPPGEAISRHPDSRIQRVLAALGDGLGHVVAEAERLREDFLPDRAYGAALARWESLLRLSPMPSDTIAARRARVLGFLRTQLGYTKADIKTALEPLLGLDSADIQLFEYTALREDGFGTDDITTPPSRMWQTHQGDGSVSIGSGVCAVSVGNGDVSGWVTGNPSFRETSLSAQVNAQPEGATFITKIDITTLANNCLYGHVWRESPNRDNALIVGYRLDGANHRISVERVIDGVPQATTNIFSSGSSFEPLWLLTRYLGDDDYEVTYSTTGPTTGFVTPVAVTGPSAPRWVGFGLFSLLSVAFTATRAANFDDAQVYEPNGLRALAWQVYRDPGLGGSYDVRAAQHQLGRQSPAHTRGAIITSLDGFVLGDDGMLGLQPLYPHAPEIS